MDLPRVWVCTLLKGRGACIPKPEEEPIQLEILFVRVVNGT